MKPYNPTCHLIFGALAATCLSLWQIGCGDNSSSSQTTQQPGSAAPTPSPSSSSPGGEGWGQVQEKTSCEVLKTSSCVGAYGFTVFNDGTYLIGPAPSGESRVGHLDPFEFDVINQDAAAVATDSLTLPYTCTGGEYVPGVQDNVSIDLLGNDFGDVIYREYILGIGSRCYIGSESDTFQLHADLHNLLDEYYPNPFPSSQPSPSPTPSASPTGTPLANGEWGGTGVEMTVSSENTSFQFDCSHGQTNEPIYVDSSGNFSDSGVYDSDEGPVIKGDPREYPAIYSGTVQASQMNLTVSYTSFLGTPMALHFTLELEQSGSLHPVCPFS